MRKFYRFDDGNQLPFLVTRSIPPSNASFTIRRLWRLLFHPKRIFLIISLLLISTGLIYLTQVSVKDGNREDILNLDKNNLNKSARATSGVILQPKYPKFKGAKNVRQKAVVNAFKHAWKGYKTYAWGYDHLKPISNGHQDWFGLGLTIIDSLDSALIMGLNEEFAEARSWVIESLSFDQNRFVSFFETTIRVLGGLLSAFHLCGDQVFLDRAIDIGNRLAFAFKSPTPIPFTDVNLQSGIRKQPTWGSESSLSEVTSVQLEFRDLSRITQNTTFEELSLQTSQHIHMIGCKDFDGLCYMFINPKTGKFGDSTITLGARADSYYEYLLKQWLQTGKTIDWLKEDYNDSMNGMEKHLLRFSEPNKLIFVGELLKGNVYSPKMDHLVCFLSGSLTLGSMNGFPQKHLDIAKGIGRACHEMYQTATGLGPEIIYFNLNPTITKDLSIKELDAHSLLRPEAIEAWFYLYRATGDKMYQEWGWEVFQAIEKYAKTEHGYSSVNNVKRSPVIYRDFMESFFLSETLKYLYLLFDDEMVDLPLDQYVFNTEGHPLPIYAH